VFATKKRKTNRAIIEEFLAFCVSDVVDRFSRTSPKGQGTFIKMLRARSTDLKESISYRWESWEEKFKLTHNECACLKDLNREAAIVIIIDRLEKHFFEEKEMS